MVLHVPRRVGEDALQGLLAALGVEDGAGPLGVGQGQEPLAGPLAEGMDDREGAAQGAHDAGVVGLRVIGVLLGAVAVDQGVDEGVLVPDGQDGVVLADSAAEGFVKVLTPPGKDRILGATIAGPHAGELIAEYVLAMKHGIGLNKILGTIHIYPTLAEANKYAAGAWKRAHAPAGALRKLERFHAWMRG